MSKYHIQTIQLTSSQAAISFNSISQQYDDLVLQVSARQSITGYTAEAAYIQFNGNNNFTTRYLQGNGSVPQNGVLSAYAISIPGNATTSNTFGNTRIIIPNYSISGTKTYLSDSVVETNATESYQAFIAGSWNGGASPISSITFTVGNSGSFLSGSVFSLYGIKRGSDGKTEVASGGAISTSGGYTYHTFTSSGTFVSNSNINADILVVAGGGGGGSYHGGGGGAGGYLSQTNTIITPGSYLALVGSGGPRSEFQSYPPSTNGGNSSILSLMSIGGGAGGWGGNTNAIPGISGGSGGGGGGTYNLSQVAGGTATSGQGNAGGIGFRTSAGDPAELGGGGGGAGAPGGNYATSGPAGSGGAGLQWLNGSFFAGGGGGGSRSDASPGSGTNGGGNGSNSTSVTGGNATPNTGSGGGAGGRTYGNGSGSLGGNGGSGIVIVRYLTPQ
jgi:hypothetical protein